MIIDTHAHLWAEGPYTVSDTIQTVCARYGISRVFISTLHGTNGNPNEADIRFANGMTAAFMQKRPDLVYGQAYLNPRNPNSVEEMKRCIEDWHMRGIKLWVAASCDNPLVNPIAEQAIAYNMPVLIHAFYKSPDMSPDESRGFHVRALAKRYPELKIVMAHMGANVYDAVKCVKDCRNVYTDFAGTLCRRDDLDYAVKHLGTSRILFGSDMPIAFEDCLAQVYGADITEAQREDILYRNAAGLYGLEGIV